MADVRLSHIYKVYDNGHKAVNDFSIDIKDKEFIVFVGPSGCGKSTTLRMIAGLEEITAGDMFIGDTLVNDMEPRDRDIAMVFQNYALYPHMTVFENMAFSLRNQHLPEEEIKKRVNEAAKILGIEEYLDRKPKAMSGGQRQRVALGRAIVRNPKVFLLDEPLSNLDAKLRAQMRTEITKLHKKLQTTFIYVTHDQVEAMTMGTRIVVMKLGYVQQIDTPMNLYNKPYNKFVAGFIGTPQMNFFDVTLNRVGEKVEMAFDTGAKILLPYEVVCKVSDHYLHGDVKVCLGIRPDHIAISGRQTGLTCMVNVVEHLGNESIIYGDISGQTVEQAEQIESGHQIIIKVVGDVDVESGQLLNLEINPEKIHLFDSETEITILEDIPHGATFEATFQEGKMNFLGSEVALPSALQEKLQGAKSAKVEVPPTAFIPGEDYKLYVHDVQNIDGKKLALLNVGDRYLFAFVKRTVHKGETLHFSLQNDKLRFVADNEVVVEPIGEEETLIGTFSKKDRRENHQRVIDFFYNIEGDAILAPLKNGYKLNQIDGNACYRNQYKYVFRRDAITLAPEDAEGIPATVKEILDYGNAVYALLEVASGETILASVTQDFAEQQVKIQLSGEDIQVHSLDVEMRIC